MSERKKQKKKKEEVEEKDDDKPTKEQYAVAKFMKSKLPVKKTTLLGHKVEYFIASKAIDVLMDSPWASGEKKTPIIFSDRQSIELYLDLMLQKKFFHRAKKFVHKDQKKNKKKDDETGDEKKVDKDDNGSNREDEKKSSKTDEKESEADKKKKRKIKLDMHLEQLFIDGNDAYVWIYDPIPMRAWLVGALIVFGSIALCLFPLWPASIRLGVYYLSVAAAGFLAALLGLAVLRLILFAILWGISMGKHHLWIFPNLMEDVGFFESFWPLYFYEYRGNSDDNKEISSKSKKLSKANNKKDESVDSKSNAEEDADLKDNSFDDENSESGFVVLDKDELSATDKD